MGHTESDDASFQVYVFGKHVEWLEFMSSAIDFCVEVSYKNDQGNIEGLADALVTLLRNPGRCASMGQAAHAFASKHLNARKTVDRLVELYDELIACRSERQAVAQL